MTRRRLSRAQNGRPAAPVKTVHLGLGNFFRAHSAWYTEHCGDDWGIAAFSGRTDTHVAELRSQDCLYTLVQQGREVTSEVISALVAVHPGHDLAAWRGYFASPEVQIVTSTITEAGYVRDGSGRLDLANPAVIADIAALQADPQAGVVTTAPGKFVAGLMARRAAGAGPITFVPCDNIIDSGALVRSVVRALAEQVDPSLLNWLEEHVSYVTSMVDRITPRPTEADLEAVARLTGVTDAAPVVTEPFSEWVLMGDFAGQRPAWEKAGATIVDDIVPFEHRKLWLLNGSHSLMAYAAPLLGCATVGEAIAHPVVPGWVEQRWDAAAPHLPLPADQISAYRAALVERFENPSIRHLLAQIAADGSIKIPIRFGPVLRRQIEQGPLPEGATRPVAAWVLHLQGHGGIPLNDAHVDEVTRMVGGDDTQTVSAVCAWLGIGRQEVVDQVLRQMGELLAASRR